jgi:hypothetical protein
MKNIPAWSTADVVRVEMQEWHKLEFDTQNAWNNVPQETRSGLKAPDGR